MSADQLDLDVHRPSLRSGPLTYPGDTSGHDGGETVDTHADALADADARDVPVGQGRAQGERAGFVGDAQHRLSRLNDFARLGGALQHHAAGGRDQARPAAVEGCGSRASLSRAHRALAVVQALA